MNSHPHPLISAWHYLKNLEHINVRPASPYFRIWAAECDRAQKHYADVYDEWCVDRARAADKVLELTK